MSYIPNDIIQQVKESVNIVDVINQHVHLTKRGANYIASCPFHEDRNPSFSVSESKQIYKCFSCGRGGNVFGFLQEIEGISFPRAVNEVATIAGVTLPEQYTHSKETTLSTLDQKLYQLHQKTAEFYHYYLLHTVQGEPTVAYLQQRQLEEQVLIDFQIGLAPDDSALLLQYLHKEGFDEATLLASGIFYQLEDGSLMDRFNGRLIVPLRNRQSQVIAFSGRVLPHTKSAQSKAKYLNSPETGIFHKSQLLFNLDQARLPIRQKDQVLVAEGYMDVLALHQAGYPQVVATMGTSLTQEHIQQLSKLAKEVIYVFDGDHPGQQAIKRAFELSSSDSSTNFKAIIFPNELDPDEWLQQYPKENFQRLIQQAVTRFDFMQQYLANEYQLSDQQQLSEYIEAILRLISTLSSPIEQQLRIQELVQEFNLDEQLLQERLVTYARQQSTSQKNPTTSGPVDLPSVESATLDQLPIDSLRAYQSEKMFLAHLIFYPEAWHYVENHDQTILFYHPIAQEVYFLLQQFYYERGYRLPMTDVTHDLDSPQLEQFLSEIIWDYEVVAFDPLVLDDCLQVINEEFIQKEIDELRNQLKEKQAQQAYEEMDQLMMQIMQLTRKLKYT